MKFLFLCVFCYKYWGLGCDYAFGECSSQSSILHDCWLYVYIYLHVCMHVGLLQGSLSLPPEGWDSGRLPHLPDFYVEPVDAGSNPQTCTQSTLSSELSAYS